MIEGKDRRKQGDKILTKGRINLNLALSTTKTQVYKIKDEKEMIVAILERLKFFKSMNTPSLNSIIPKDKFKPTTWAKDFPKGSPNMIS